MQIDFNANLNLVIKFELDRWGGKTVHSLLSTLSCQSFLSRIGRYLSLINFALLQIDGEH
jgi:hypothetical protein